MKNYKKLIVWQKADAVAICTYKETAKFPKSHAYKPHEENLK